MQEGITITFDEVNNGWASFWSYHPEWITRLNKGFYTFKNGELFRHHSETANNNVFYDDNGALANYDSSITTVFNEGIGHVKHFKTISLESSSNDWNAEITSNLDYGHINDEDFVAKEGEYYGYIRRNEGSLLNFEHLSIQGIGANTNVTGYVYTFNSIHSYLNQEDYLCYFNTTTQQPALIAKISNIDRVNNKITTNTPTVPIVVPTGAFMFVAKNSVAESFGLKGIYMLVKLTTTNSQSPQDIFAVNTECFHSSL